jgi:hypothetical protein
MLNTNDGTGKLHVLNLMNSCGEVRTSCVDYIKIAYCKNIAKLSPTLNHSFSSVVTRN